MGWKMRLLLAAAILSLAASHRSHVPFSALVSTEWGIPPWASLPSCWSRPNDSGTFLNRIRQDDAFSSFIHRTMLNEEN